MPERIRVDHVDGLPVDSQKVYTVGERRFAVFNVGGTLYAIDNACPHKGASLGKGPRDGLSVSCPLHRWEFDLATGECVSHPGSRVRTYEVLRQGEDLILDITDEVPVAAADQRPVLLVRYGALGWVGRFTAADENSAFAHRERVLLRTGRGLEVGEVLAGPSGRLSAAGEQPSGEVLRMLNPDEQERTSQPPWELVEEGRRRVAERNLPVEVIDGERLLDGETVVLYYLGAPDPGLTPLAADWEAELSLRVHFQPVIDPPAPAGGGCGSGTCGCKTA